MARGRVYNRTYTPELWEQVNPENKAILEQTRKVGESCPYLTTGLI